MNNISLRKRRTTDSTQDVATKRRISSNGSEKSYNMFQNVRRCGKLISMRLTNFMCHSNLAIDFHSRVNFVVGNNGSGKSAILAALVLGLGGNARTTNRSSSAKGFIKTGEVTAKIEIVIANDGPQPFEPQVYGDKIIVVRTISTASGSYAIKSANGLVITKKFEDLYRILMYHNVQVDNPLFVLNQDNARELLKNLEPQKLYQIFLKASQSDIVMEKLNECLHLHKTHKHELFIYEQKLRQQRKDITDNKDKLKELLAFEQLKDDLARSEIEHEWLLVKQLELKLAENEEKLDKYFKEEKEILQITQNKDKENLILNREIKKLDENIASNKTKLNQLSAYSRNIRNKINDFNKLLAENQIDIDLLTKKKKSLEQNINTLKHCIEEQSNRIGWGLFETENDRIENEEQKINL